MTVSGNTVTKILAHFAWPTLAQVHQQQLGASTVRLRPTYLSFPRDRTGKKQTFGILVT